MAIELSRIRLQNWKCYQEEQIQFDGSNSQHIWIVFGQNGAGKTSLLEAIQWCLYGGKAISSRDLLDRFNRVAVQNDPTVELGVELVFKRDGRIYAVSRVARRVVRGTSSSANVDEPTFRIDGVNQGDARERIEDLLPSSCSQFFFFDGVEIKRYAQRVHTQETREAIERILGIPELRNLRDDAERAVTILDERLAQAAAGNEELQRVVLELDGVQEEIATAKDQLNLAKEEHKAAISILESVEQEGNRIDALRGKLEELHRQEREEARFKEDLDVAENQIETVLQQASIPLLSEFIQEVADDMQRTTMTTARRAGSTNQLRTLLNAEVCLCGRPIDEHARQHIHTQLEDLHSSEGEGIEAMRQDNMRNQLGSLARFRLPSPEDLWLRRDRLRDELEEVRQAAYRLKQETGGLNVEQERDIWRKRYEVESAVKERRETVERFQRTLTDLEQQANTLRRQREQFASHHEQMAQLARQAQMARGLSEAAKELIEWRILERKEAIEKHTSEIHRRVTNKPDEYKGIEIRADYTLGIKNAAGAVLDPETLSAGEKEALAFSFIAGLNLASGTAAPFIMDTPFGHLDTDHQKNLVSSLPELPSQVVVLATDRDLPAHLLQSVRSNVAGILNIRRLDVTEDASTVESAE